MIFGLLWIQSKLMKLHFDIRNYDALHYLMVASSSSPYSSSMTRLKIENEFIPCLERMYSFPKKKTDESPSDSKYCSPPIGAASDLAQWLLGTRRSGRS
jgi:hypothetical protein